MRLKFNEKKENHNVAVDLWLFVVAIAMIGFDISYVITNMCDGSNGYWMEASKWFSKSNLLLLIISIIIGFFMVHHYKKETANPLYKEKSASVRAWEYIWKKIKKLLPILIISYFLGVIICTKLYYPEYGAQEVWSMLVNSIWEFLGLHASGLRNTNSELMYLNSPLWYISALLVSSYFIYWLLCKHEDAMKGFVAPVGFISLAGWIIAGNELTTNTTALGVSNGLLYVIMGLFAGITLNSIIELLANHHFTKAEKLILTLVNLFNIVLLIWYSIYPKTYFNLEKGTVIFLCLAVTLLSLLNVDYFSNLINNKYTSKFFTKLGKLSLYIYALHYPIATLLVRILGQNTQDTAYNFWLIFIPTVIITILLSVVMNGVIENITNKKSMKKV